jgi:Fe-S-cluster containining protein
MECCKVVIFQTRYPATAESIGFFAFRGLKSKEENGYVVVEIDKNCPFLSDKGCTIYASRPQVCRDYDCSIHAAPFKMVETK